MAERLTDNEVMRQVQVHIQRHLDGGYLFHHRMGSVSNATGIGSVLTLSAAGISAGML
jgi:hypothetical protein